MHQPDVLLGQVNLLAQAIGVGIMEFGVGSITNQLDGAISKSLPDFLTLLI